MPRINPILNLNAVLRQDELAMLIAMGEHYGTTPGETVALMVRKAWADLTEPPDPEQANPMDPHTFHDPDQQGVPDDAE